MDTSYQNINRAFFSGIHEQFCIKSKIDQCRKYLFIALACIARIGSLVAAGCLYSQLGYASFAFAGGGIVLGFLCFFLSKYCRNANSAKEGILDTLTKSAQKEEDAYLIDFSKVNPANLSKIFNTGPAFNGVYGDVSVSNTIDYDESSKFTQNFSHTYSISVVSVEKNEYGYNTSSRYTFTMNDEGKVESYGQVFDNFDAYLEYRMKSIYLGGYLTFKHFDFQSVQTDNGYRKLRKKPSAY